MIAINAIINCREDGAGPYLVSSGFPLRSGDCTEADLVARKAIVTVGGDAIPAHISALRGRHSDGSIRSLMIQFQLDYKADEVAAVVTVGGGVRAYGDPDFVPVTYAVLTAGNVIVPSDPDYLCSTWVAFQGLLPFGDGNAAEEKQFTTLATNRFTDLKITNNMGTATYETGRAFAMLWQRSGDLTYYYETIDHIVANWCSYNFPAKDTNHGSRRLVNPENINYPGQANYYGWESGAEWEGPRNFSYAAAYLMTGYVPFWSAVAAFAQSKLYGDTSVIDTQEETTAHTLNGAYPRYVYNNYSPYLTAALLDATLPIPVNSIYAITTRDYTNNLQWVVNSLIERVWDVAWLKIENWNKVFPASGTPIVQGSVSATRLGTYANMQAAMALGDYLTQATTAPTTGLVANKSKWRNTTDDSYWSWDGTDWVSLGSFPTTIYLQLKNSSITGGAFSVGAITSGIVGDVAEVVTIDARNGMLGVPSNNSWGRDQAVPLFQCIFPANFLIDYYNNFYADSRIPEMVQNHLAAVCKYILPFQVGDTRYGGTSVTWGALTHGNGYNMMMPVASWTSKSPWVLPEFCRMIAFVRKAIGDLTVEGKTLSQWYDICINTANNAPELSTGGLIWEWKLFGQYYGMNQDAAWISAQETLEGPSEIRELTMYSSLPDGPEFYDVGDPAGTPAKDVQFYSRYVGDYAQFSAYPTDAVTPPVTITLDFPDTAPCSLLGYQVWSKLTVTDEEIATLWEG